MCFILLFLFEDVEKLESIKSKSSEERKDGRHYLKLNTKKWLKLFEVLRERKPEFRFVLASSSNLIIRRQHDDTTILEIMKLNEHLLTFLEKWKRKRKKRENQNDYSGKFKQDRRSRQPRLSWRQCSGMFLVLTKLAHFNLRIWKVNFSKWTSLASIKT